MSCFKPL